MGVHAVFAVEIETGPLSAGVGFHVVVVRAGRVDAAEVHQVHLAAARGTDLLRHRAMKSAHQDINDALVRKNIGVADGGGIKGIENGAFGGMDMNGAIRAGTRRQIRIDHGLARVIDTGAGGTQTGVQGPHDLRRGAREVGREFIAADPDRDRDPDGLFGEAVVIEKIFEGEITVGQIRNAHPHAALGVIEQGAHGSNGLGPIGAPQDVRHPLLGDLRGRDLGHQIAPHFQTRAHVLIDDPKNRLVHHAALNDFRGGNLQAFLVDFRDAQWHAPRRESSHVHMVRGRGRDGDRFALIVHHRHHGKVREMAGAFGIRKVRDDHVARLEGFERELRQDRPNHRGHDAQMKRCPHLRLGEHFAVGQRDRG